MGKTQKNAVATYVLFKVTTCLYLSPNKRARNLSTLIAVNVNKDTEAKMYPMIILRSDE